MFMNEITVELLNELIEKKDINRIRVIFEEYNKVDLAEKINELDMKKSL